MGDENELWAILELMGHVTHAGRLTEEERFGSKMGRLDIPRDDGGFTTIHFCGSSVYRLTIVSEEIARAKARSTQPRPVSAYEMEVREGVTRSLGLDRREAHNTDDESDSDHDECDEEPYGYRLDPPERD